MKQTVEASKETSVLETGKEQQSGTKVVESVGVLSSSSHISDCTKTKSAPLEQPHQHPTPENTGRQTSYIRIVQISLLPVLNSSVSRAAPANQPFTDLQHVQLRAQIFVYGALM